MVLIHNNAGDIIQRSKNLSGIRRFASQHGIESIRINGFKDGTGMLTVVFYGAQCTTSFASFEVLQMFVRDWRNAHGVPITVNGLTLAKARRTAGIVAGGTNAEEMKVNGNTAMNPIELADSGVLATRPTNANTQENA